ncbi:MAG: histidine triad nucleotide-binding protein [Candidatus Riflebacteria bacterium]|nr:histidine triad nucleotide-binding protein [Candidatus Riflebacteria bacterium]
MANCIFCRIVARQIPSTILFENEKVLAFRDAHPQAPTHILIIPKIHVERLSTLTPDDLPVVGECVRVANLLAEQEGISKTGYRLVANCGEEAGQSVWHVHFHLLGGRRLGWPPG